MKSSGQAHFLGSYTMYTCTCTDFSCMLQGQSSVPAVWWPSWYVETLSKEMAAALTVKIKTSLRVFGWLGDKEPLERYESLKMICCPHNKTHRPNAQRTMELKIPWPLEVSVRYRKSLSKITIWWLFTQGKIKYILWEGCCRPKGTAFHCFMSKRFLPILKIENMTFSGWESNCMWIIKIFVTGLL